MKGGAFTKFVRPDQVAVETWANSRPPSVEEAVEPASYSHAKVEPKQIELLCRDVTCCPISTLSAFMLHEVVRELICVDCMEL